MSQELPILKKGAFYLIKDAGDDLIMEDRTKRGLTMREHSVDENLQVFADKGMIHDVDGIGHLVPIRWYFPKKSHDLQKVLIHAERMEKKYAELRELTCPDDMD
jgi:hypothetical protein